MRLSLRLLLLLWLLLLVPVPLILKAASPHAETLLFVLSMLAIVPLAVSALGCDITLSAVRAILDDLPFAIYSTDADGRIVYFNPASVEFAGRLPMLGRDKWCVSWKIYSTAGALIPHDQCPMAVAIHEGRNIRGVMTVAERPNGTRVPFTPYPTPILDRQGKVLGAFNMLLTAA